MFGGIGYQEMLLYGVIAILLFGKRLPDVARKAGSSYRELKKSVNQFQKEFQSIDSNEPPRTKQRPPAEDSLTSNAPSAPKFTMPPPDDE